MSLRGVLVTVCLLLLYGAAGSALADEFWLSGNENGIALPAYHDMLEDKSGKLTTADLPAAEHAGRFVKLDKESLNFGYSTSAFWFKVVLVNPTKREIYPWLEVGPTRLQHVSLHLFQQGHWQHVEAGSSRPFSQRPMKFRQSVFPLGLGPGETVIAYIRIASETAISVETRIWNESTFRTAQAQHALSNGLLLGVVSALLLCGLILFQSFGRRAFLFHALSLLAYVLYEMSNKGYGFMLLWPNATIWATHSLALFGCAASVFRVLFLREFLRTRDALPRSDSLLLLLVYLQLAAIGYSQFIDYRQGAYLCAVLGMVSLLVGTAVGCLALVRRIENARVYLGATLIIILGSSARYLDFVGVSMSLPLSEYGPGIAVILASTLLLSAMIEGLIQSQRKKDAAQNQILSAAEAQRQELERAVQLRTRELDAALLRAEAANQAKSTLLAHISHDLRAPLATIIGHARLLRGHTAAQHARYSIAIENSAQRQLALIDELLEYSQSGYQGMTLVARPVYLLACLREVALEAESLAAQQHNRFSLQLDGPLPAVVLTDLIRLHQVLLNLLSNAAKFTCDGEIVLSVRSASPAAGESGRTVLRFQVSDTGSGIEESDFERIFEPFQRGAAAHGKQGVGLGLCIARLIVSSMGGQLLVSSVLGEGSCFHFSMPVELAPEPDAQNGHVNAPPLDPNGVEHVPLPHLPSAEPGTNCAEVLPAMQPIPPGRMRQLDHFVENGLVTEIEEWIAAIRRDFPESDGFASEVELALRALDFGTLTRLCASQTASG